MIQIGFTTVLPTEVAMSDRKIRREAARIAESDREILEVVQRILFSPCFGWGDKKLAIHLVTGGVSKKKVIKILEGSPKHRSQRFASLSVRYQNLIAQAVGKPQKKRR